MVAKACIHPQKDYLSARGMIAIIYAPAGVNGPLQQA